jgi:outer membrane murein-binding lipoprotein Lpp
MNTDSTRSPRRLLLPAAVLACVVLGSGCSKKDKGSATSDEAAKLKPTVSELMSQLAKVSKKAGSEPETDDDEPVAKKPSSKTVAITGEHCLKDPTASAEDGALGFCNTILSLCKSILEKTELADGDVGYLEQCSKFEYAAVIRQKKLKLAKINDDGKTFKPGEFRGDVLVFHLPTGKIRGRYSLYVTNDLQLELEGKSVEKDEWAGLAKADLRTNVESNVKKYLE